MGLTSTLYTGISGLQASSEAMSVTGNNIANSGTTGFKSSSTLFSDVLSATISSASGSSQVGRGSEIATVRTNFSQGTFETTSSTTDLAIDGDGFFMVSLEGTDEVLYTRDGSFSFDDDGYLVNAEGYRVQGRTYNEAGELSGGDPTDIQIEAGTLVAAQMTENIELTTNLDSSSEIISTAFDITDPDETSNYSTSTTIYDTLGNTHLATTYFTKTGVDTTTGESTWEWYSVVASDEILSGSTTEDLTQVASGTLVFNENGELTSGETGTIAAGAIDWNNGSSTSQEINFSFNTTQYNTDSEVISQDQDGCSAGELVNVSIDTDGNVIASYSNGETQNIAMITLATFVNAAGLLKEGGNLYSSTSASGEATVGVPGSSQGTLLTSSLELSNVDLAQEFVKMITLQNAYSANSRVITTIDDMLSELINLKR
ncbi:MAG: flagellar hook protein FlgE [Deltaproteobacteria bacterium]|nr:flagellar hook protein FlgE [Deltaproteobacteria bacterium]